MLSGLFHRFIDFRFGVSEARKLENHNVLDFGPTHTIIMSLGLHITKDVEHSVAGQVLHLLSFSDAGRDLYFLALSTRRSNDNDQSGLRPERCKCEIHFPEIVASGGEPVDRQNLISGLETFLF